MNATLLIDLFGHKRCADAELAEALAGVDAAAHPEALRAATRTLNHIHVVDEIFRAHLGGRPHGYTATNTPDTPALAALADSMHDSGVWYGRYAEGIPVEALHEPIDFHFTDGDAGRMTRLEILLHVLSHGSYHRGAIGQLLRTMGVSPPRDLFTRHLREHGVATA